MSTIERFYEYKDIYAHANCLEIAKSQLGLEPVGGQGDRFNIPWRPGSDSGALSMNESGWTDHVTQEKGGVIELVRRVKFGGAADDIYDKKQDAQQFLGDLLSLKAKEFTRKEARQGRSEFLKKHGYIKTMDYPYHDEDGSLIMVVQRWEHTEKQKEFVQCDAFGNESVKHVKKVLYRWPEWKDQNNVCICEGEKDADTLRNMKVLATTNSSGCGTWNVSYSTALKGKDVIIFTDNDIPGRAREGFLLWELRETVGMIKVVRFNNEVSGFDVTDYFNKYGEKALLQYIKKQPVINKSDIKRPQDDYHAIQEAKQANRADFCNYIKYKTESGEESMKPRQINDLVDEVHIRFLGFPRKVGETLFDHDRKTNRINIIRNENEFFSWIQSKSKRLVNWKAGTGYVTKKEFFAAIEQSALRYEEISYAPSWPERKDAYPAFPALPNPDSGHPHLHQLIDFFNPASPEYKILLYSFFAAPLYYEPEIPRPSWIIDSEDGAGTGKTTLAEVNAILHGGKEIRTNVDQIKTKFDEITKRIVSVTGRQKKILLLDNVTGLFHCSQFADMVTSSSISGRPPYGRGEETRPNNLTFIITANSATIDNDTAQRSYFIYVKAASGYSASWKTEVIKYVEEFRYKIIAEILDAVQNWKAFNLKPQTRFPEFETKLLQPFCQTEENYQNVLAKLAVAREESNVDPEMAARIQDYIKQQLIAHNLCTDEKYFIRSEVMEVWLEKAVPTTFRGNKLGYLKNLIKQGFANIFGKSFTCRNDTRRGFILNPQLDGGIKVIGFVHNEVKEVLIK
ncbi:MAG: hypothetical protein A2020_12260 [Lentisphaerae bacterium GWF2_45_14]|nr:MAG: hypothetical protein A2020_12260 [Lentisphaerae bacterium GWF2_45_14]